MSNIYVVVARDNDQSPWELINIMDPSDFNDDHKKAEAKAIGAANFWQELFPNSLVSSGPMDRSKVNHCMEAPKGINTFRQRVIRNNINNI